MKRLRVMAQKRRLGLAVVGRPPGAAQDLDRVPRAFERHHHIEVVHRSRARVLVVARAENGSLENHRLESSLV